MPIFTPATGSIISNPNGSDRTGTSLSTNIIISVAGNPVGAIQSLTVNEDRPIEMVAELGTDGFIDSAPIKSTAITGDCKRIRYDSMSITEAFSRDFLHAAAQRIPFDILIMDQTAGDDTNSTVLTTIQNVWITRLGYSFNADNWFIIDDMSWKAETIYSTLLSGASAASSGARAFALQTNADEMATDVGLNRGALSAPGVIDAVFT
jgi:hypothetical protein